MTHAMELVAAAKMRKSQEKALSSRPYTVTLHEIIAELRPETHRKIHQLLTKHKSNSSLIILLTSDRGLVGGLNLNVIREIAKIEEKNKFKLIIVGKKGLSFAVKTGEEIIASFHSDEQPFIDLAKSLTKLAVDLFLTKEVKNVYIVYPDFQSTVKQVPTVIHILPINLKSPSTPLRIKEAISVDVERVDKSENMIFEPSADKILEDILPHLVLSQIYQALLEAKASEHSARMVAMKNATDAANDLVDDLTLTYNQARQEAITNELLDIVTAQSAFD